MAEGQFNTENSDASPQQPPNNNNNPFFFLSLIPKMILKPFEKITGKSEESGESAVNEKEGSGITKNKTLDVVTFPKTQPEVPPLKLENEDAKDDTNPLILWQIYALGGFIVLKWAWGKWQEWKANKRNNDSSGEDQPRASDPATASNPAPASDLAPAPAED